MKWFPVGVVALSASCSPGEPTHSFEIEDYSSFAVSAVLSACGSDTPLHHKGALFTLRKDVYCDGDAQIPMRYKDGRIVGCEVGPPANMPSRSSFIARESRCDPLLG